MITKQIRLGLIGAVAASAIAVSALVLTADTASSNAPRGLDCEGKGSFGAHVDFDSRATGDPDPIAAIRHYAPTSAQLSSVFTHPRDENAKLIEWYGAGGTTLAVFDVVQLPSGGWVVQNYHSCPDVQLPSRDLTPEEQADYDEAQERLRRGLEQEQSR